MKITEKYQAIPRHGFYAFVDKTGISLPPFGVFFGRAD